VTVRDTREAPGAEPPCSGFYSARDLRNQRRFNLWLFVSALAFVAAAAAVRWRSSLPATLPWLAVGVAVLLALLSIRSYLVFLRAADELLRRIQTEALAFGFGAGALVAYFSPLAEKLGAPKLGTWGTALVMMFSWSLGTWLGMRRYSRDAGA